MTQVVPMSKKSTQGALAPGECARNGGTLPAVEAQLFRPRKTANWIEQEGKYDELCFDWD
jgi:hypothetical protein